MSRSEGPENSEDRTEKQSPRTPDSESHPDEGAAGWFAASTLRVGLALAGFILLLFALGQVAGLDLLELFVDALNSRVGRWLIVAFFALLLIVVAARGFGTWSE